MKRTLFVCVTFAIAALRWTGSALAAEPISESAKAQIQALQAERASRTPTELKIDSQLIYAVKLSRKQIIAPGVTELRSAATPDGDGRLEVDITGTITPALIDFIVASGGRIVASVPRFDAARALIPLGSVYSVAARNEIRFVRAATRMQTDTGSVLSQGYVTHEADFAKLRFGVDGSGVKVGVLSDSVDFLAASQASGNTPPNLTVLPGQAGNGTGEGTAMLEIIHDLAPGAQLFFATANGGGANFAQNILALQAAGCDVIVDDVRYPDEPVFQDGVVARAVNAVTASGVLYFASAGNSGNKSDGTSGTWEGDFVDGGPVAAPTDGRGGRLHSFGPSAYNVCTGRSGQGYIALYWADPLGASTNDYDLYVLDAAGNNVVASSTTVQNGTQDPFEITQGPTNGQRVVVVKVSGDARFLHIDTGRGRLEINTDGFARGHSAATNALATAAVDVATASPSFFTGGAQNPVETFSSDGPRRMFFHENGAPITPGNFLSGGGAVRPYPAIAAADGVATSVPGFAPFFGTSAAAPHAAAVGALLKSYNPLLTSAEMRNILTNSALDIEAVGVDSDSGAGIVMAYRALNRAPAPGLSLVSKIILGGNGNGVFDPNECNQLQVLLQNRTPADFSGGALYLYSLTPGITVANPVRFLPGIPSMGFYSTTPSFQIASDAALTCGTPVRFILVTSNSATIASNELQFPSGLVGFAPAVLNNNSTVAIPDNNTNGVNSAINVAGFDGGIGKVTVSIHITHPLTRDLVLQLIGPDGTKVNLARNRGGTSGANFGADCSPMSGRTIFDDNAPDFLALASAPFIGSFRPDELLQAFVGLSGPAVNGTWRLHVEDQFPGNLGSIDCWTLSLYPSICSDGGGTCSPDVMVSASASPNPALLGFGLEYSIRVSNAAPVSASGVVLSNVLPPACTFVSAEPSQGGCSLSGGTVLCNLGALAPSSSASIRMVVQPTALGLFTNVFNVTALGDNNYGNNIAKVVTPIIQPEPVFAAAGAELIAESFAPASGGIESGETVTMNLTLRNTGPVASANLVATLQESGGVSTPSAPQAYGSIAPGATGTAAFSFTAPGAAGSAADATLQLQDGVRNLGTVTFHFTVGGEVTVESSSAIVINPVGPASPYPATINVSGVSGLLSNLRVTFTKLSHSYPDDIDALLVGPRGQKLVLMSDAGGGNAINNRTITFDAAAAGALPNESVISAGAYLPANYDSGTEPGGDIFPSPAPGGPFVSSLEAFNSTDPNGTWSLFINDDGGGDGGSIAGGWSIAFNTIAPVNAAANLAVTATAAPSPAIVGETLTYTLNVVNAGPSNAAAVVLSDTIPANCSYVSSDSTQGTVSFAAGVLTANLGTIAGGGSATIHVRVTPNASGLLTNSAVVSAASSDLDLSNNSTTTVVTAANPVADLAVLVTAAPSSTFVSSNVTFTVTITNRGPSHASGVQLSSVLSSVLEFVSATNSQGTSANAAGTITSDLGSLAANGSATVHITAAGVTAGLSSNSFTVAVAGDPVADNNVTNVFVAINPLAPLIVASGAALTAENPPPANNSLDSGETVTIMFGLRNVGTADTTDLSATLIASGGVSAPSGPQSYGALAANGPTVSRPFTFVVGGAPGSTLTATLQLQDGAQNLGTVAFTFTVAESHAFTNSNVIIIPDHGVAGTYPSTVAVSGITGSVSKVTVTIRQLTHTFPEDIDMLLVGPAGQKVMLMSDAGAGNSLNAVTLTFDDSAAALPFASAISTGTYHPTDYQTGETLPGPAPSGPYGTSLSVFNGTDPNGTWSLYVLDDASGDAGRIDGGWSLDIQTASPVLGAADVGVSVTAAASVEAGVPLTYTATVVNYGPASATAVTLTDVLPAAFALANVSVSQGSYTTGAGTVTANLGTLNSGATATITVVGAASSALTNVLSVSAAQVDPNLANNTASAVTTVGAPRLNIWLSGTNAVITWPSGLAGFVLESSGNASGPFTGAGLTVTSANGTNQVSVPAVGTKFYRLRK